MNPHLLPCAALAFIAGSLSAVAWADSSASEARQWLERMIRATQALNYEGTFIYAQGPHMETMRVIHRGGAEGEQQRLFSLNGPDREILIAQNDVVCLPSKQASTSLAGNDYRHSPFPLSSPQELDRLASHYAFELLGEDRVAGLDARVIAIKPRDSLRYGYRLWLEQKHGLALRSALVDDKGYPVEQIMFTDLQIKEQIAEAALTPPVPVANGATVAAAQPPCDAKIPTGTPVTQSVWRVDPLPEGFIKVLHNRFMETTGRHLTEHMVFSDGLATISVFVEHMEGEQPLLQGESQLGSINAFGTMIAGKQVLVVGEVPALTVQRIADSIQNDPAMAKDP